MCVCVCVRVLLLLLIFMILLLLIMYSAVSLFFVVVLRGIALYLSYHHSRVSSDKPVKLNLQNKQASQVKLCMTATKT